MSVSKRAVAVCIGASTIRLELRSGATMLWQASLEKPSSNVGAALNRVLSEMPRSRWRLAPPVIVTVASPAARIKKLHGLPPVEDVRVLTAIVRENATQFFLGQAPFVTTDVYKAGPMEVWCGAIDAEVIDDVVTASTLAGYRVRSVHPEADPRLSFYPIRPPAESVRIPVWRARLAMGTAFLASIMMILAPAFAAGHAGRVASRALVTLAPNERRAMVAERARQHDVDALAGLTRFEGNRRAIVPLLASLADGLPRGSALAEFRADTTAVELVVLSARVAEVLVALDTIPGVSAVSIVGSVQPAEIDMVPMERATLRFQYDIRYVASDVRMPYPSASQKQRD